MSEVIKALTKRESDRLYRLFNDALMEPPADSPFVRMYIARTQAIKVLALIIRDEAVRRAWRRKPKSGVRQGQAYAAVCEEGGGADVSACGKPCDRYMSDDGPVRCGLVAGHPGHHAFLFANRDDPAPTPIVWASPAEDLWECPDCGRRLGHYDERGRRVEHGRCGKNRRGTYEATSGSGHRV